MAGDALLLQDVVPFKILAAGRSCCSTFTFFHDLSLSSKRRNKQLRALRCSHRSSVRVLRVCDGSREVTCDVRRRPDWYIKMDVDRLGYKAKFSFRNRQFRCSAGEGRADKDEGSDSMDDRPDSDEGFSIEEEIPSTSDGFLKQVSSPAYDLRRKLEQSLDSSSYDVLDSNPWRDDSKSLYVLAQEDERLLTMRTRRARSEVERELGLLFPKRGSRRGPNGSPRNKLSEQSAPGKSNQDAGFRMQVEDVREGVLVFEDEEEAAQYCNLLDGQGKGCLGIAELEASDVFAMCKKTNTLAVFFPRGTTPPLPNRLQHDLKARRRSLED